MSTTLEPSRLIGPEDIRPGDYVTIAHSTLQILIGHCEESWREERVKLVRMQITAPDAGWPLKVINVCAPFVLVKNADGDHAMIDMRCDRLARLRDDFAKQLFAVRRAQRKAAQKCRL